MRAYSDAQMHAVDVVADAVAWLFSDEASFINAAIVPVDGGMIAL